MRFSDPVGPLTAHRVRRGVGAALICQPGPSSGIKTHLSPAAFPIPLFFPFPPFFTVLHRPPVVPQATVSSTFSLPAPGLDRTDTTRPVEKMPQHDHRLLFARRLGSIVSPTIPLIRRPLSEPLTMTLMERPAF